MLLNNHDTPLRSDCTGCCFVKNRQITEHAAEWLRFTIIAEVYDFTLFRCTRYYKLEDLRLVCGRYIGRRRGRVNVCYSKSRRILDSRSHDKRRRDCRACSQATHLDGDRGPWPRGQVNATPPTIPNHRSSQTDTITSGAGWHFLAEQLRAQNKFAETKFIFPNAPSIPDHDQHGDANAGVVRHHGLLGPSEPIGRRSGGVAVAQSLPRADPSGSGRGDPVDADRAGGVLAGRGDEPDRGRDGAA
nr:hypothetical protein CFP56_24397 [Quercus suber]